MHWLTILLLLVVVGALGIVLFAFVHWGLQQLCIVHAHRFCCKSGLTPLRCRSGTVFAASGMKTEFTIVELDCRDAMSRPKMVRLKVWAFGVREVLDDEEPSPPPTVPAELLPRSIPYNPSFRSIVFFFVLAIFFLAVVQFLHWPRLLQVVVSILILSAPILILLRRFIWPRQIIISDCSITVPVGFLRLRPVCLPYSDIAFVSVACLGATFVLCIHTSNRTLEIQDLFLPDRDTFELLRYHLGTFVRTPPWDDAT